MVRVQSFPTGTSVLKDIGKTIKTVIILIKKVINIVVTGYQGKLILRLSGIEDINVKS